MTREEDIAISTAISEIAKIQPGLAALSGLFDVLIDVLTILRRGEIPDDETMAKGNQYMSAANLADFVRLKTVLEKTVQIIMNSKLDK